jgi:hypothetical protein
VYLTWSFHFTTSICNPHEQISLLKKKAERKLRLRPKWVSLGTQGPPLHFPERRHGKTSSRSSTSTSQRCSKQATVARMWAAFTTLSSKPPRLVSKSVSSCASLCKSPLAMSELALPMTTMAIQQAVLCRLKKAQPSQVSIICPRYVHLVARNQSVKTIPHTSLLGANYFYGDGWHEALQGES